MPKKSKFEKFNLNGISCKVKCVDVYDGDTITVEVDFRELIKKIYGSEMTDPLKRQFIESTINQLPYKPIFPHCRMAGYNSAEISRCTKEEKIKGLEAKEHMKKLVLEKELWCHFLAKGEGELIKLKTEDPYGRPITDIYLLDENGKKGKYVNETMISEGYAAHYDGHGPKTYQE